MKWLLYLVLFALVGGTWYFYIRQVKSTEGLEKQLTELSANGDPQEKAPEIKQQIDSLAGERTFSGILLTFLSAGLVGILFVVHVLPFFAQRLTHAVYDSAEVVQRDGMSTARSLLAQGDYEGAIAAFREAAVADPLNRLPWMEIAKIYKDNLEDPQSAIATIRGALETQEWEINDAAYFLFRLAELYDEVNGDRASAIAIMNQVIEQFPSTRHSANAAHKLHEWSLHPTEGFAADGGAAQTALEDEEAEYLARVRQAEQAAGEYAEGGGEGVSEDESDPRDAKGGI